MRAVDAPRRVLVGPWVASQDCSGTHGGVEFVCFGAQAQVPFTPFVDSLEDVLRRVPGPRPDALLLWEPQVSPSPRNWEAFDGPMFAAMVDWPYLCALDGDLRWTQRFERVYMEQAGVDFFARLGLDNARQALLCSFDPARHYPRDPAERLYDVAFAGALTHPIHRERSKRLRRVAALADRWRVALRDWTLGPDAYADFIRSARIVVNYTLCGGANIRCFEALAVEALLFIENTNVDMPACFEDGVHYVTYTDDNLEDLIAYYLEHEDERRRIAHAGWQRVQQETHQHHLARLGADMLEALQAPATQRSHPADAYGTGARLFVSPFAEWSPGRLQAVESAWLTSVAAGEPSAVNAKQGLAALWAAAAPTPGTQHAELCRSRALAWLDEVLTAAPQAALAHYVRGQVLEAGGNSQAAAQAYIAAIEAIQTNPDQALSQVGPYYPYRFDAFMVEWMYGAVDDIGYDRGFASRARILQGRCHQQIGRLFLVHSLVDDAAHALEAAAQCWPESADVWVDLGVARARLGQWHAAAEAFHTAQEQEPFHFTAWLHLLTALLRAGEVQACLNQCQEYLTLLSGLPDHADIRQRVTELHAEALQASLVALGRTHL